MAAPESSRAQNSLMCECDDKEITKENVGEFFGRASEVFYAKMVRQFWLNPLDYVIEFKVKDYIKLSDRVVSSIKTQFKSPKARADLLLYKSGGASIVVYDKIYVASTEDKNRCGFTVTDPGNYLVFGTSANSARSAPLVKIGKCLPMLKLDSHESKKVITSLVGIRH